MKIWITRHGQTNLNKAKLMQGLTDEPLNERGIEQAKSVRQLIEGKAPAKFDAVYASPLDRAITTASIVGNVDKSEIIIDERIIEADFGKYEQMHYAKMGPAMTLYWMFPEFFPTPKSVETIESMTSRSSSFLKELESKDYENVLIVCHGGIIRALCGYLQNAKRGIVWRPKPKNCEVRVYESINGTHRLVDQILPEK